MALLRIYFAHPCFTKEQEEFKTAFLARFRALSQRDAGGLPMEIVDPFRFAPVIEGSQETKLKLSGTVKDVCLRLLEECDLLLGLTDWGDTGVAFEAGYAHSLGKPVVLLSRARSDEANAMLLGAAQERFDAILTGRQMERLVSYLAWRYAAPLNRTPGDPAEPGRTGERPAFGPQQRGGVAPVALTEEKEESR